MTKMEKFATILLIVSYFIFTGAYAINPISKAPVMNDSIAKYCKVKVYSEKQVQPLSGSEKECAIGKRRVILTYDKNRIEKFRFGKGVFENPIVYMDSIAPNVYRVSCFHKNLDVDFSKGSDVNALIDFHSPSPGFTLFYREYVRTFQDDYDYCYSDCTLRIEFPEPSVPHATGINQWLVSFVNEELLMFEESDKVVSYTKKTLNKLDLAKFYADWYFAATTPNGSNTEHILDMRTYAWNNRYVTYQLYSYNYSGGAHGAYMERLASFDLISGKAITPEYLFQRDSLDKVREALMRVVLKDSHFKEWNSAETIDDVLPYLAHSETNNSHSSDINDIDISRMGLTPEGVVISYYPYEVSCYAAGCFHFTIPYEELYPFLSDAGKQCVGK